MAQPTFVTVEALVLLQERPLQRERHPQLLMLMGKKEWEMSYFPPL